MAADGQDLSWLQEHGSYEIVLFDARRDDGQDVRVKARMVRRDPGGVAFQWDTSSPQLVRDMMRMLEILRS